jgi:23S rRNA maturation mini-RNase III
MNLEKSVIETVKTVVQEIRQTTCAEKQAKSLMKIYDAITSLNDHYIKRKKRSAEQ